MVKNMDFHNSSWRIVNIHEYSWKYIRLKRNIFFWWISMKVHGQYFPQFYGIWWLLMDFHGFSIHEYFLLYHTEGPLGVLQVGGQSCPSKMLRFNMFNLMVVHGNPWISINNHQWQWTFCLGNGTLKVSQCFWMAEPSFVFRNAICIFSVGYAGFLGPHDQFDATPSLPNPSLPKWLVVKPGSSYLESSFIHISAISWWIYMI